MKYKIVYGARYRKDDKWVFELTRDGDGKLHQYTNYVEALRNFPSVKDRAGMYTIEAGEPEVAYLLHTGECEDSIQFPTVAPLSVEVQAELQ